MKCENLQLNLPIYFDDCLSKAERAELKGHLKQCPLCRQRLDDFQILRTNLRGLARPQMAADALSAMRNRIALEAKPARKSVFAVGENAREWLEMRLLPYGAATALTLVLGLSLLWSLFSTIKTSDLELAKVERFSTTKILPPAPDELLPDSLSAADIAAERLAVSGNSPSINPRGALVALTRSIVRGKMKDEEVVVVADVFGDGLAQIAEVVEPSSDKQAVRELRKALETDPNYAPFVPAKLDNRSDNVRVILKIQEVNINTNMRRK